MRGMNATTVSTDLSKSTTVQESIYLSKHVYQDKNIYCRQSNPSGQLGSNDTRPYRHHTPSTHPPKTNKSLSISMLWLPGIIKDYQPFTTRGHTDTHRPAVWMPGVWMPAAKPIQVGKLGSNDTRPDWDLTLPTHPLRTSRSSYHIHAVPTIWENTTLEI